MDWDTYEIIQQLKKKGALRAFRKWLRRHSNQVENTNQKLLRLLEDPAVELKTEEEIWQNLKGNQPFKARTFAKYRHDLKEKCLEFIAEQELKSDALQRNQLLTDGLMKLGLENLLENHLTQCQKNLEKKPLLGVEEHFALANFYETSYRHTVQTDQHKSNTLPKVWEAFDQAWLLQSLRLACMWHSRKEVKGQGHEHIPFFLPFIEHYLALYPPTPEAGLRYAFSLIWNLFQGKSTDPEPVFSWLNAIEKPEKTDDFLDLFWLFHNYLTRQANGGNFSHWGRYLLDSYVWGIKHQFLYHKDHVLPGAFRNLILTAIRCGKSDLAWEYLQSLQKDLPPDDPNQSATYCEGYYHYSQQNYREMRSAWKGYFPQSLNLEIGLRLLKLQARYEEFVLWQMEDDWWEIKEDLPKLERLVAKAKKLSDVHKQQYAHRFDCFQKLLDLEIKNLEKLRQFRLAIAQDDELDNRAWFLSQLDALLEKREPA